jgi:glycosyltransferase involved in cell wall biosynthesis
MAAGAPSDGPERAQDRIVFSVCIPVFNDATWLPSAIQSVVAQTYADWELVVSDNCSQDDLASIVRGFADARLHYRRWDDHVGTYENHNRALDMGRSDWIVPIGADDRLHPAALEAIADTIRELAGRGVRPSMVVGAAARIDEHGMPAERRYYGSQGAKHVQPGLYDASRWFRVMTSPGAPPWNIGSIAFHRQALVDSGGGFRPEIGLSADNELVFRLAAYAPVAYVGDVLADFTVRTDSDGNRRFAANRAAGDPQTPMGVAMESALRAFEARGLVRRAERWMLARSLARLHLQRAGQHRILHGGRGWRGALMDVGRALRHWPLLVVSPSSLVRAAGAVLAPAALIRRASAGLSRAAERGVDAT